MMKEIPRQVPQEARDSSKKPEMTRLARVKYLILKVGKFFKYDDNPKGTGDFVAESMRINNVSYIIENL